MRKGFVLLEVMVASLIAALLSTSLLTTIVQVNRLQETVSTITSVYGRIAILQNQMERDIMGAFVPAQVDLIQTTTERKAEKVKPITKVFYGKNAGGRLDVLTCITSNPLQIYFGIKDRKLKPRVARVVYRLEPDKRRKNSFVLMRQEGRQLMFDAYKKDAQGAMRSYEMIDGIQSFSVQYISVEQKKSADGTMQRTYKKQNSWDSLKPQTDPKKRREPVRLPNLIELQVALWDSAYKVTRSFTVVIPIMAMSGEYKQPAPPGNATQ
ncbi:prepilin-type N-terminal cleavage/methylation domain-containing protein, partial [Candidatus Dependentiae bacterium]